MIKTLIVLLHYQKVLTAVSRGVGMSPLIVASRPFNVSLKNPKPTPTQTTQSSSNHISCKESTLKLFHYFPSISALLP